MIPETLHMEFAFVVLAAVFFCFVKEWIATEMVALGGMAALILAGVTTESDLKVIFGNSAPITIGAMFILSEGLIKTGAITWIARKFTHWAGDTYGRTIIVLALIVMPLSAFLNNTPVVVIFLPVILAFCRSSKIKASKLLIPLSFLSILGGTMTLIGTSTNLLVAGVAKEAGQPAFGIFEISGLGLVYAVVGFTYLYFFGNRLLPERDTISSLLDAEDTRGFLSAAEVTASPAIAGKRLTEHPLLSTKRKTIVYDVVRRGQRVEDIPLEALVLEEGDVLWFRATSKEMGEIRASNELVMIHEKIPGQAPEDDRRIEVKTVEAIIGSQSSLIGRTLRQSNIRRRYGVVVAAVHRRGMRVQERYEDVRLAFGDTLLIEGPVQNLVRLRQEDSFLSLNELDEQTPRKSKIFIAVGVLAAVVLASAFELFSITSAAIAGAVIVVLTRCVEPREAYKSIEWPIIFLIYAMLAIGRGMETTGGAALIATSVVGVMEPFGPLVMLSAIYLLSSILTEFVTNNAVAILITPIVISIATALEIDARPFIVAIMFGASASFITPIGYQTNTYVYGAGNYRFADFLKVGIPLNLILWMLATLLIPKLFPF